MEYEALYKRAEVIYARNRLRDVEEELGKLTMQKLYWEEQLKLLENTHERIRSNQLDTEQS